jgi:FtsZ-binding cell division protein ZapB
MSSFQHQVLRFFSKPGAHRVIKNDASYFNEILTFEDWDSPITGFRDLLKEQLASFRELHQINIDDTLKRDTRAYRIATMAPTESVSWLEGCVVFMDNNQRDLTKARFGSKKAWHVTTRLARQMLLELAIPRDGVQNSFKAGQNIQVCQRIYWVVLKSHNVMSRYKRHNFKDDPSVSSKLVKFLAVNTGFELLEVLSTKVTDMVRTVASLQREVQVAVKAAGTLANRADEAKKLYDQLAKRVGKLEH